MALDLSRLSRAEIERYVLIRREEELRSRQRQFFNWFPDEDIVEPDGSIFFHARRGYPKHLEHFAAGKDYPQRLFMAANQVGKSTAGGYETTAHLTGLYPEWWEGRRWDRPIKAWVAGKNAETTRDIVQAKLLGPTVGKGPTKRLEGTGMIPGRLLGEPTWKQGYPSLVDTIQIKHTTGGWSELGFKTYEQGRGSFEGTVRDLIWLDEEVPIDVFGECLIRTLTVNGSILMTFTPLEGLTPLVKQFLEPQEIDGVESNN